MLCHGGSRNESSTDEKVDMGNEIEPVVAFIYWIQHQRYALGEARSSDGIR